MPVKTPAKKIAKKASAKKLRLRKPPQKKQLPKNGPNQ